MGGVWRVAGAVVAGVVVAFVLVIGVELFGAMVHPLPAGFGGTKEEMCAHVERFPAWVLAAVVPMWGFCGFAGAWIGARLGNVVSGLLVGMLALLALGWNLAMLPYPWWFKFGCLVVVPAACVAGVMAARRKVAATAESSRA